MMKRHPILIPALLLIALFAVPPVFAHAKLLSSKPSAGESLAAAPGVIELEFSTRIQRDMSAVEISASDGRKITLPTLELSADEKILRADLPELSAATYNVIWRALSADDHPINGEFSFRVGSSSQASQTQEGVPAEVDHSSMDHGVRDEGGVRWGQSIARWLIYLCVMLIGGGLVFRTFILLPLAKRSLSGTGSDRLMKAVMVGAAAVLIGGLILSLGLQTNSVFGSVRYASIYSALTETNFGTPWMIQFAAAAAVLLLISLNPSKGAAKGTVWDGAAFGVWLLVPAANSMSGHARAASYEYGLALVSDWVHVIAAAVWIGGILFMVILLPNFIGGSVGRTRLSQLTALIHKFNRFAIGSTAVLVATGIYNSWIHIESVSALLNTLYGQVLLGKIVLTGVMIGLGALNAFVLRPRMAAGSDGTSDEDLFVRSVRTEAAFAVVVLLLAAILAFLPPAREHAPSASGLSYGIEMTCGERNG